MEPAVRSIFELNERFDTNTIDIVACPSALAHLFRFVSGKLWDFDVNIELVGSILFLVKAEESPGKVIENSNGYGHTFPEASTYWGNDVHGSTSHQRIIGYRFRGLSLLVRFESDGYFTFLGTDMDKRSDNDNGEEADSVNGEKDTVSLTDVTCAHMAHKDAGSDDNRALKLLRVGSKIPQDSFSTSKPDPSTRVSIKRWNYRTFGYGKSTI